MIHPFHHGCEIFINPGIDSVALKARKMLTDVVWGREKLKNPMRNETLMLAVVSGMLAGLLTLALKSAFTGL